MNGQITREWVLEAHTAHLLRLLNSLVPGYFLHIWEDPNWRLNVHVVIGPQRFSQSQHLKLCSATSCLTCYHQSERSVSQLLFQCGEDRPVLTAIGAQSLPSWNASLWQNHLSWLFSTDFPAMDKLNFFSSGTAKNTMFTGKRNFSLPILFLQYVVDSAKSLATHFLFIFERG